MIGTVALRNDNVNPLAGQQAEVHRVQWGENGDVVSAELIINGRLYTARDITLGLAGGPDKDAALTFVDGRVSRNRLKKGIVPADYMLLQGSCWHWLIDKLRKSNQLVYADTLEKWLYWIDHHGKFSEMSPEEVTKCFQDTWVGLVKHLSS